MTPIEGLTQILKKTTDESVKDFIKANFPDIISHKVGDRFKINNLDYILASTAHGKVALVCLYDGLRWRDNVDVKNDTSITPEEWKKIIGTAEYIKL